MSNNSFSGIYFESGNGEITGSTMTYNCNGTTSNTCGGLTYYQYSSNTNLTISNCTMNWNSKHGFLWYSNFGNGRVTARNSIFQFNGPRNPGTTSIIGGTMSAVLIYFGTSGICFLNFVDNDISNNFDGALVVYRGSQQTYIGEVLVIDGNTMNNNTCSSTMCDTILLQSELTTPAQTRFSNNIVNFNNAGRQNVWMQYASTTPAVRQRKMIYFHINFLIYIFRFLGLDFVHWKYFVWKRCSRYKKYNNQL